MARDARRDRLIGRRHEQQLLAEIVDRARGGSSGMLVLRGEAGIGKTALLTELLSQTADLRTISLSGAESEMELAYAGVQQLCAPLLGRIDRLPEPQKKALRIALGLREGTVPDRLLVGLGRADIARRRRRGTADHLHRRRRPVGGPRVLAGAAFAARRLLADPVVMIFAARTRGADLELAGLPELTSGLARRLRCPGAARRGAARADRRDGPREHPRRGGR